MCVCVNAQLCVEIGIECAAAVAAAAMKTQRHMEVRMIFFVLISVEQRDGNSGARSQRLAYFSLLSFDFKFIAVSCARLVVHVFVHSV